MKCPGCQYICSDLRDLCPKCLLDLRNHKRALGLSVGSPNLSYQDLLERHAQKSTPIKSHSPAGGFGSISYFFKSLWNDTESGAEEKISEATESHSQVESPIVQESATPLVTPVRATQDSPSPQASALDDLFDQCFAALAALDSARSSSLSFEQLAKLENKEQIELYFDLCAEALKDPSVETRYQEQIKTSETRNVMSEALNTQVAKVEKILSSAVFSLKGRAAMSLGSVGSPDSADEPQAQKIILTPAPWRLRARSFFIDMFFICAIAALAAISYFSLSELELLGLSENLELSLFVGPLALALLVLVALTTIYPFVALTFFGTTFGLDMCGLRLLNAAHQRLSRENAWIRSLIFPISLLSFGWLPLLFGRASLHDRLAKTEIYLEPVENF